MTLRKNLGLDWKNHIREFQEEKVKKECLLVFPPFTG